MKSIVDSLLDLVFAPVCLACDRGIAAGDPDRLVCRLCRTRLISLPKPGCPRCGAPILRTGRSPGPTCGECGHWPPSLRSARSACLLHPPADRIVHQIKYRGWRALAEPMAERMAAVAFPVDVEAEARIVVPVPTTATRQRERGYNQAELIARAFAARTGREFFPLMERISAGTTQTVLQPAARGANVAGAFRVTRGNEDRIQGEHLLLVDDVLTTGATAIECTRALVGAGARCVSVITFARALDARRLTTT